MQSKNNYRTLSPVSTNLQSLPSGSGKRHFFCYQRHGPMNHEMCLVWIRSCMYVTPFLLSALLNSYLQSTIINYCFCVISYSIILGDDIILVSSGLVVQFLGMLKKMPSGLWDILKILTFYFGL